MQSTFDERNWLAWLVKVRILILTFLLAIQLTVAHLDPRALSGSPFRQHHPVVVCPGNFLRLAPCLLARASSPGLAAGSH